MIARKRASNTYDVVGVTTIGLALAACSTQSFRAAADSGAGGRLTATGGSSHGGSGGDTGIAGMSTGIAGTAGTEDGSAGSASGGAAPTVIDGLHGRAFDLGAGRVRLEYDFSTPEQAQDFSPSTGATLSVTLGQLDVANASGMAIALFVKQLHADRVAFAMTLLEGSTTNWYVNTVWDGGWNPAAGYGAFHDQTGRVLLVNGAQYPVTPITPVAIGKQYQVVVDQTDSLLSWSVDAVTATQAVDPLPVTDRSLGLGGWDSTVAIDDLVIEGTLAAP